MASLPLFCLTCGVRSVWDEAMTKTTRVNGALLCAAVWALPCCGVAQSSAAAPSPAAAVSTPATSVSKSTGTEAATTIKAMRQSIDAGHAADVLVRVQELRAQASSVPGLSTTEGLAQYALGNLKAADEAFAAAIAADPDDAEAKQMRGLTLFRRGRPADAIPLLEASATGGPLGKADPHYVLALCYMDTRRYDDARHAFAAQFNFPPDGAAAYLVTARMLLRREFRPVAQQFAEKALGLKPALPLAHELLGEIALAGNHLDEAIGELEAERAQNPLEGLVYDRLGDAYSRAAKYDDAQRSLQEALLLEPNATGPYILLGKTMMKKADPVAAATYLERADQMDPANLHDAQPAESGLPCDGAARGSQS